MSEEENRSSEENTAQELFEQGMPEAASSASAIPSSLDAVLGESAEMEGTNTGDVEKISWIQTTSNDQPGTSGKLSSAAYSHIAGWGIDADPSNDPTYPIKKRTNEEQLGNTWERPTQQAETVEVLRSNERNNMPAVFGTPNPPKGLSGVIRRFAFKYSESDYLHWLPLVLADKIGVYEGIIDDLRHGHIPNRIAESGLKAEWKYNKKALLKKAAVKVVITSAVVGLIVLRRNRKKATG